MWQIAAEFVVAMIAAYSPMEVSDETPNVDPPVVVAAEEVPATPAVPVDTPTPPAPTPVTEDVTIVLPDVEVEVDDDGNETLRADTGSWPSTIYQCGDGGVTDVAQMVSITGLPVDDVVARLDANCIRL